MVSLRRHLGSRFRDPEGKWKSAYCSLLAGVAECAEQVCPPVSAEAHANLTRLHGALSGPVAEDTIERSGANVDREVQTWRDRAASFYRQRTGEFKEIMMTVARTAALVGERDRSYGPKFNNLAGKLRAAAEMEDLPALRTTLLDSVNELNRTVEQMRQESEHTVATLQSEISNYRAKLESVEQAAAADSLTGLANRRCAEREISRRMKSTREFCLLVADLNGLKRVNDQHGHLAGDELLSHFAAELQHVVRTSDMVARWGGDEFVVLLDGDRATAEAIQQRIRQWAFGSYTLQSVPGTVKVEISAALGMARWEPGMDQTQLFDTADRAMYQDKASHRVARLA